MSINLVHGLRRATKGTALALLLGVIVLATWQGRIAAQSGSPATNILTANTITSARPSAGSHALTAAASLAIGPVRVQTPGQIEQYARFEWAFDINNSVATNLYFPYDAASPAGTPAGSGITVDALLLPPGITGWDSAKVMPCFYYQPVEEVGSGSTADLLPVGKAEWRCRFTPDVVGTWSYKIRAMDAGGTAESSVSQFNCKASTRKGFVKVSATDSAYFEFSDGTPFVAPLVNIESGNPLNGLARMRTTIQQLGQNGARFVRWFPTGEGANYDVIPFGDDIKSSWGFGSAWLDNEDIDIQSGKLFSFVPYYYSSQNVPAVAGARYRLSIRAKVWGDRTLRVQISNGTTPIGQLDICANSAVCSNARQEWNDYTLEVTNNVGATSLNVFLRNGLSETDTTVGNPKISSVRLQRYETGVGDWGPNLLTRSDPDTYNYVDQVGATRLDEAFRLSEQYGVYHKLTLFHKNDAILGRLLADGTTGDWSLDNFYAGSGQAARWYELAYARYFTARWSYSPALHSVELGNENMLTQQSYNAAFAVAQEIADSSPRHVLQSNSFWGWFVDDFWTDPTRGYLMDYADKHWYANRSGDSYGGELISALTDDSAANVRLCWSRFNEYSSTYDYNKPIMRGETGVAVSGTEPQDSDIARDAQGTYYHKQLWAHLGTGGYLCDGEWYTVFLTNNNLWGMFKVYEQFVQDEPLSNGRYQGIGTDLGGNGQVLLANTSGSLRAWGVRDRTAGRALLWVDNANHTWKNVVNGGTIASASGILTIQGLPAGAYSIEWRNTTTGALIASQSYTVGSDGRLGLTVSNLATDQAVKIVNTSSSATPTATSTPGDTTVATRTPTRTPTRTATPGGATATRTATVVGAVTPSTVGLAGYWKLDEGSGTTAVDASGNGLTGSVQGGASWVTGQVGSALSLNGVNSGVRIGDSDLLSPHAGTAGEMTVAGWVKVTQLPAAAGQGRVAVVGKGGPATGTWEYALYVYADGAVGFSVWQASSVGYGEVGYGEIGVGEWHYLAGTVKKGQYVRVYLDGALVDEVTTLSGDTANGSAPLYVGRRGDGQYYNGVVDEVRVYNRALSEAEIEALMVVGVPVATATATRTATATATRTIAPTATRTVIATASRTPTRTATRMATSTNTATATRTATATSTATRTATATASRTATSTATRTATATSTATRTATATATIDPSEVVLSVDPPLTTVSQGEQFEVTIRVHAGAKAVDGAAAYVDFDPALLHVISVTAGSSLAAVIQNSYDNTLGQVNYSAGVLNGSLSGTFSLMTIRFETDGQSGASGLVFASGSPRKTAVSYQGQSVLDHTLGGTVTVGGAMLGGTVELQGRPAAPDPRWVTDLTVSVAEAEGARRTYTTTTTAEGAFRVGGLKAGTYEIAVKNEHTLRSVRTVSVGGSETRVAFGVLAEGDANNDDCVTLLDFSTLSVKYAQCSGGDGFDKRVDFNADGCVDILDFSLLSGNFGQTGGTAAARVVRDSGERGGVEVRSELAEVAARVGHEFTVTLAVEAGEQKVDGVVAYLDFDPTVLQVKGVTPGGRLTTVIQNRYDNEQGWVDYAAGVLGNSVSGEIELVMLRLEAVKGGVETELRFGHEGIRSTDVSLGGQSVIGPAPVGIKVMVGSASPDTYGCYLPLFLR